MAVMVYLLLRGTEVEGDFFMVINMRGGESDQRFVLQQWFVLQLLGF